MIIRDSQDTPADDQTQNNPTDQTVTTPMQEPPHRIRPQQTRIRQMLLVATQVEIPETIQTEQQAEIPEKTPVVTQAEMVEKTPVATQAEIPEKTTVATQAVQQVEIPEITPVVIQVELPVVPPEAEQPSRFFFAVLSGVLFFAAYAPVTIGNKHVDNLYLNN